MSEIISDIKDDANDIIFLANRIKTNVDKLSSSPPLPNPPEPEPEPPSLPIIDAPYQPFGSRIIKQNPDATKVTELFAAGRLSGLSATKQSDGSWRVSGSPRWHLEKLTSEPVFDDCCIVMDYKHVSGDEKISLYAHGENHSTDVKQAWHGSKNSVRFFAGSGNMDTQAELYHQSGDGSGYKNSTSDVPSGTGKTTGKFQKIAAVWYKSSDKAWRVSEGWVKIDNVWKKVIQVIDKGTSVRNVTEFNQFINMMRTQNPTLVPQKPRGLPEVKFNSVVNWGGDWVSVRCDNSTYDFKNIVLFDINKVL